MCLESNRDRKERNPDPTICVASPRKDVSSAEYPARHRYADFYTFKSVIYAQEVDANFIIVTYCVKWLTTSLTDGMTV